MGRKRYTSEQITGMLREAEVLQGQGMTIGEISRKLRDELLNGEIFDTLFEARVLLERWRREYNCYQPHSSLGYKPPAPEAFRPNILSLKVLH